MSTDSTFITNEEGNKLIDRFNTIIKDTVNFDVLVGYFYTSGFYKIYKSLEHTEKIRILVGITTDKNVYDLIQESNWKSNINVNEENINENNKNNLLISHKETKNGFSKEIKKEFDCSEDSYNVEEGANKFIEWLKSGKLEIKAYRDRNIHAKVYITTFHENDKDDGRVITGSSNFTSAGLQDNLEFNVELKNKADYEFALNKFNELWKDAVDVKEPYINTITSKTWLNDEITPYELFLKFLYEYLKDIINLDKEKFLNGDVPPNFMDLQYQRDAVFDGKRKIENHGGVFLSDVVGLGKTYMATMLAKQLGGRTLVIAPPNLLKKSNPGSWTNAAADFNFHLTTYSKGKLDQIIADGHEKFSNVIIDEAHEFRNENTAGYEMLYKICRGKRVILVSATPFNNEPSDILAQLKLFQNSHDSTLPNPKTRDLESYFGNIDSRLKRVKGDKEEYLAEIVKTSSEIRDDILRYLMVRRTRTGILKHYKKDLEKQGLKFPDVNNPQSVVYELDGKLDTIFNETLDLILNEFKYSRYTPLLYLKDFSKYDNPQRIITPQKNMFRFMKTLLFKRLESSFYAFKESINRFIYSYEHFIKLYNAGTVYISKKKINKIYQYFDEDNFEKIDDLVNNGSAETYNASDFNEEFIENLKHDLEILNKIKTLWNDVDSDPKLDKFIEILKGDTNLKEKLIVFTEAEDTMNYLTNHLNSEFDNKVLGFSGSSSMEDKHLVINNFDGKASKKSDDYRILISTDVLSQGMNLHQSNVVINYDIPWNPTKMMQRVGRVQRLDSEFNEVFIYNFFPASHISENLSLEEAAKSKLEAFIEMLGADSKLLLDEEIKTHELFTKLNSKSIFDDDTDDDSELEYLTLMRDIRDNDKELYDKIKAIPKKARTAKKIKNSLIKNDVGLFTFFRKGGLMKMYLNTLDNVLDIDFETATQILKANPDTKREDIGKNFYKLLNKNKNEFNKFFSVENEPKTKRNRNEVKLKKCLMALKNYSKFTDLEYNKINSYIEEVNKGSIPKKTLNKIFNELNNIKTNEKNEFSIFHTIRDIIDETLFDLNIETNSSVKTKDNHKPKEIILSEYLIKS